MKVGVVVVAYQAPSLLRRSLEGLHSQDVVVIDNSSMQAVFDVCLHAGVRYVDPGGNVGFGAGVNIGISELWRWKGECDVLLLNPDAVITPTAIERLTDALHERPRTAAVAPRLLGPTGEQRSAWPWPAPGRMWREALGLLGNDRSRGDWLVGAVLLVSASAYVDVGPFDETFFLYAEETDWQRRAVDRGWRLHLVSDAFARHVGAGTSSDPTRREALFHAGTETYVRKWSGRSGWLSYRLAALIGASVRSILPGRRGAAARRRASIYARGPRRAAGRLR